MTLLEKAEKHIKEKFSDYDHCSQSARAVAMFLQGVEWTAREVDKQEIEIMKFGPDIDGDADIIWRENEL